MSGPDPSGEVAPGGRTPEGQLGPPGWGPGSYPGGGGNVSPWGRLGLSALIPAAGLSTWAARHGRPRCVGSVTRGIRWRWLLRCLLVVGPLCAAYVGVGFLGRAPKSAPPTHWVLLLGMVVVLTPL